jgi:hypothetical protein
VRAASEHPRIAVTVAVAILALAIAGVEAGRALGTPHAPPSATAPAVNAVHVADARLAALRGQLQAADVENVRLRERLVVLAGRLARARRVQRQVHSGRRVAARRRVRRRRPRR